MTDYIERYWRDATPQDAIKEPPMVARFRHNEDSNWLIGPLEGFRCNLQYCWYSIKLGWHKQCQVYDAPDPGEGWRLVDTENEKPQAGDEVWVDGGKWEPMQDSLHYSKRCAFRRRIEQPKPKYEPFRWEDREQLRGRWIVQVGDENAEQMINKMDFAHNEFYANNKSSRQLLNDWTFLDTGEPVGRRVE